MSERKSREQVPDEEEVWACVAAIPPFVFYFFLFLFVFFFPPTVSFARSFCPSPSQHAKNWRRRRRRRKRSPRRLFRWRRFLREDACAKRRRISRNSRTLVFELQRGREKLPCDLITTKREREREEKSSRFSGVRRFSRQEVSSKDKDKTLTQLRATRIRRRGRGRR